MLTEIPMLEAWLGLGMGRGPARALLLAGPALSLPSMAVIHSVMGFTKTTMVRVSLCANPAIERTNEARACRLTASHAGPRAP